MARVAPNEINELDSKLQKIPMNLSQLGKLIFGINAAPPVAGLGYTYTSMLCTWTIQASGKATLEVERDILFNRKPAPEDLYDTVFGSQTFDFESIKYRSPDADVADVAQQNSGGAVQVFWKPRGTPPQSGVIYHHTYHCRLPDVLSPEFKNYTIAARTPTSRYTLKIVSLRPVQDAICYRAQPDQDFYSAEEIYRRANKIPRRRAPQPRQIDENTYEVTIEDLHPGDEYFVILRFAKAPPGHPRPRLVVVVPGLGPLEPWQALLRRLKREEALVDTTFLELDHGKRWHSFASAEHLAHDIRAHIDEHWCANGPYTDVVLVGHSLGALLVRRAYLMAAGVDSYAPKGSPWAERVSRLILFAGINRGVKPDVFLPLSLAVWFGRAIPFIRRWLFWDLLRGSDFVTNLRIQWIRHFASLAGNEPVVVQLLGTSDSVVKREDSFDVEQFPNAYYQEIAEATHNDLFHIDSFAAPETRYAYLRDAFVNARPHQAQNVTVTGPEEVVFVLHGIRADNRTWVQDLISIIGAQWPHVKVIGPKYEYFSALRFAIPMTRQRNLQWFRDAYTEALSRNPQASFCFVGHSNGTYIFGESLRAISGMQFQRAVLIGSVLPVDFDWETCAKRGQIKHLRVDGSSHDWPVGWLCSFLHGAGMSDVGTGGFDGFTRLAGVKKSEHFWYAGGHSAPLASTNLPALATFAVTGVDIQPAVGGHANWFALVSRALRRLALPIVVMLLACFAYLTVISWLWGLLALLALSIVVVLLDII